jgi:hypothetical protein
LSHFDITAIQFLTSPMNIWYFWRSISCERGDANIWDWINVIF